MLQGIESETIAFLCKPGLRMESVTGQQIVEDSIACIWHFRKKTNGSRTQVPYFWQPQTGRPHQSIITMMQMGQLVIGIDCAQDGRHAGTGNSSQFTVHGYVQHGQQHEQQQDTTKSRNISRVKARQRVNNMIGEYNNWNT